MQPEFLFDFGSPNAYLSHLLIPGVEQRTGVCFKYVPILLGGVFRLTNNKSPAESFAGIKNKPEFQRARDAALFEALRPHRVQDEPVLSGEYAAIDARCGRGGNGRRVHGLM